MLNHYTQCAPLTIVGKPIALRNPINLDLRMRDRKLFYRQPTSVSAITRMHV